MWKVKKADLPFLTQAVGQALGFLTVQKHQRQIIYIYIYYLYSCKCFFTELMVLKDTEMFSFLITFLVVPPSPVGMDDSVLLRLCEDSGRQ